MMERHPEQRELVNYARDALREQKKQRILEHCRGCPECAERLIEAVREHGPDPGPIRLTRWNKISLAALALALIVLVVTFVLLIRGLGRSTPPMPETDGDEQSSPGQAAESPVG